MEQKIIYLTGEDRYPDLSEVEDLLKIGWKIKDIYPQHVATGAQYSESLGGFLIILEKNQYSKL